MEVALKPDSAQSFLKTRPAGILNSLSTPKLIGGSISRASFRKAGEDKWEGGNRSRTTAFLLYATDHAPMLSNEDKTEGLNKSFLALSFTSLRLGCSLSRLFIMKRTEDGVDTPIFESTVG